MFSVYIFFFFMRKKKYKSDQKFDELFVYSISDKICWYIVTAVKKIFSQILQVNVVGDI